MANIGYKYRANTSINQGKYRDVESLISNELHASSFKSLNDPFEASVELPPEDIRGNEWVITVKQAINSAGVYSLVKPLDGETFPSNELMWAHYADSHKGFCIVYDLDILMKNLSLRFDSRCLINVSYQEDRPEITSVDDVDSIYLKAFGTKSRAWEKENETRIIFMTQGIKPVVNGAVRAIYFGLNITNENRTVIINGLRGRNIDFYQIERIGNTYKLKATKLTFEENYEIVKVEHRLTVDNYMILYNAANKDKNTISSFVEKFRKPLSKPSNITIIDDLRVKDIIDKPRMMMSLEEIDILSKHWVAYSSFDAPTAVWMYPER